MQRFYYCVVFDNDPDLFGVLQFCDVGSVMGAGTNLTPNLEIATEVYNQCKERYPEINYTIMKTNLIPVENV